MVNIARYDPTASSTSKLKDGYTYQECYPGYCSSGVVFTDVLRIGDIVFSDFDFLAMTNNTRPTTEGPRSGNLGLNIDDGGMQTSPTRVPTLMQRLVPQLENKLWTVDFHVSTQTGQFDFGYIDESKYTGNIGWAPVVSTGGLYQVEIRGVGAGYDDASIGATDFKVVVDTGSGGGTISRNIAQNYWNHVPNAKWDDGWDNFIFPCGQALPDFVIQLADGNRVGIPGSVLPDHCTDGWGNTMLAIGSDDDTLWGSNWIERYFIIFDHGNKRVGFAQKSSQ